MDYSWVNSYIGKGWGLGSKGPENFDCLGLARDVLKTRYNVELPEIGTDISSLLQVIKAIKNHDGWKQWKAIDKPEDGCLVKLYRSTEPDHIGIWINADGGGILHSSRSNGVCFDNPFVLKAAGWGKIDYYKYRGANG